MAINEKKKQDASLPGLLKQFDEMKKKHPDAVLLFRVGDFYESYRQDAEKVAEICDINTVTRKTGSEELKLAGFPHHALDTYLPLLVRAGSRIAICEQLDNPRLKKNARQSPGKEQSTSLDSDMPRKKKEKAQQEEPAKTVKAAVEEKPAKEKKTEAGAGDDREAQQERKTREPQMITVNGDKVTHGHAYQGNTNTNAWFFTARLNGVQLKPQLMDMNDVVAFSKKELTVPQLMALYYPTKLMPKVPETAFKIPNVIAGPAGNLTVEKFNVYKEKDPARDDFGKYKFYAKVDGKSLSAIASREDLNAYFDRVMTPGQIVEKNFGERLHLQSHYSQYRLPDSVKDENIRIAKSKEGAWIVQVDLGTKGKTSRAALSYDDGFSYFQAKSATKEQIAAKYLGGEIHRKLAQIETSQSKSIKI